MTHNLHDLRRALPTTSTDGPDHYYYNCEVDWLDDGLLV